MEAKNADLSALRIDRAADPVVAARGARRWLVIGGFLPAVRAARLNIVNALRAS
jgi:hypothetical protein